MKRTPEQIHLELVVLKCLNRESDGFTELVTLMEKGLIRHALHLIGRREVARDVVQEAWIAIVKGLPSLGDPARFRAWAYQIVTHKCIDWRRKKHQEQLLDEQCQELAAPSDEGAGDEIRHALRKLPGEQRALVALHYLEGMGVQEMAEIWSVPVGTIKSRLYHARQHLKDLLERKES